MWRSSLSQFHSKHCIAWVTWENNFPSRKCFSFTGCLPLCRGAAFIEGWQYLTDIQECSKSSCPCSVISFMVLGTKVLPGLRFPKNASSGAGPGLEQGLFPLLAGCPEISAVARSDDLWRTFCVSWVLWLVWLLFCFIGRSCAVCLFPLCSVKGLNLAVVVLASTRVVQQLLWWKETF